MTGRVTRIAGVLLLTNSIYATGTPITAITSPWYAGYIDYLVLDGVIQDGGLYMAHANEVITRLQFAQLFANAMPGEALEGKNLVEDGAIPDVRLADAGGEAVYNLYRAGVLIDSDSKGNFNPQSDIRRSEVAAIVVRMAVAAERKSVDVGSDEPEEVIPPDGEFTVSCMGGRVTLTLPADWYGHYIIKESDTAVTVYNRENYEAMENLGSLFEVYFTTERSEEELVFPDYRILSEWDGGMLIVALRPTDVQFLYEDPDLMASYMAMDAEVEAILGKITINEAVG